MQLILKTIISISLGAALALSFIGAYKALVPQATFAQPLNDELSNDFQGDKGNIGSVSGLIQISLGFIGLIAIVFIILGAVQYFTAGGGDANQVEGRKLVGMGIIGLALIISIWGIAQYVIKSLTESSQL